MTFGKGLREVYKKFSQILRIKNLILRRKIEKQFLKVTNVKAKERNIEKLRKESRE